MKKLTLTLLLLMFAVAPMCGYEIHYNEERPSPEEVLNVCLAAFLPHGNFDADTLTTYFRKKIQPRFDKEGWIHSATAHNEVIGYAIFEKWNEPNTCYLAEMGVSPAYQMQGIGKALVFSIFEKAPNTQKILLLTRENNIDAQNFYKKLGFVHSSFKHPNYPEGYIAFEYTK